MHQADQPATGLLQEIMSDIEELTGTTLMLACWPGTEMLAPATWIHWLRTGDDAVRKQAIPNLAAGRWELGRWTWRDTTLLARFDAGTYRACR